ncbi:MAG: hypothetical protein AAGI27_17995 [Pseudomonadota bacterium]
MLVFALGAAAFTAQALVGTSNERLVSIAETGKTNERFIAIRCDSFRLALFIYRQIMRSNPVDGRDSSRGAEFEWIDDPRFANPPSAFQELFDDETTDYVQEYLDFFGGVAVPTVVPNMPLYQSDKETCLRYFASENGK